MVYNLAQSNYKRIVKVRQSPGDTTGRREDLSYLTGRGALDAFRGFGHLVLDRASSSAYSTEEMPLSSFHNLVRNLPVLRIRLAPLIQPLFKFCPRLFKIWLRFTKNRNGISRLFSRLYNQMRDKNHRPPGR
jgi:hypothetical protein